MLKALSPKESRPLSIDRRLCAGCKGGEAPVVLGGSGMETFSEQTNAKVD